MGRKFEQPCLKKFKPGGRPEAKMLKFRIDRQVTVFLNLLLKFVKRFTVGQVIKFIVRAY